jgi:hypothetical protein
VTAKPIRRDPDVGESGETENKKTGNRISKRTERRRKKRK